MLVDIGTTTKRINSTKTDFTKTYKNVNVLLKEPTSMTHPQFLVHLDGLSEIHKCNYLYTLNWGYFWIDDIIYETNDLATLICHRDVLATGKSLILQTDSYVNYTSKLMEYNNPMLQDDPRLSPDIQYLYHMCYPIATIDKIKFSAEGCVLVKVLAFTKSAQTLHAGAECGIVTYIMPVISFQEMARLCADELIDNLNDSVRYLLGDNLKDNFLCARYLPLDMQSIRDEFPDNVTSTVNLGGFLVNISNTAVRFDSFSTIINAQNSTLDLGFANNTLAQSYSFLRGEKYTRIQFIHPGGNMDVSSDDFILSGDQVNFKLSIDMCSGDYAIKIQPAGGTGVKKAGLSGSTYPILTGSLATDWTHYWTTMSNPNNQMKLELFKAAGSLGAAALGNLDFGSVADNPTFGYTQKHGYAIYNDKTNIGSVNAGGISSAFTGVLGKMENSYHQGRVYNQSVSSNIMTCHATVANNEDMSHMFRFEVNMYAPHVMAQNSQTWLDYYPTFAKLYGYPTFANMNMSLIFTQGESHFVQCAGFNLLNTTSSLQIVTKALTPKEMAEINILMNNGVYLE